MANARPYAHYDTQWLEAALGVYKELELPKKLSRKCQAIIKSIEDELRHRGVVVRESELVKRDITELSDDLLQRQMAYYVRCLAAADDPKMLGYWHARMVPYVQEAKRRKLAVPENTGWYSTLAVKHNGIPQEKKMPKNNITVTQPQTKDYPAVRRLLSYRYSGIIGTGVIRYEARGEIEALAKELESLVVNYTIKSVGSGNRTLSFELGRDQLANLLQKLL